VRFVVRRSSIVEGMDNFLAASLSYFPLVLLRTVCSAAAQGTFGAIHPQDKNPMGTALTLALARRWDAESGVLVGWLPCSQPLGCEVAAPGNSEIAGVVDD
jgi:hypothetical protein